MSSEPRAVVVDDRPGTAGTAAAGAGPAPAHGAGDDPPVVTRHGGRCREAEAPDRLARRRPSSRVADGPQAAGAAPSTALRPPATSRRSGRPSVRVEPDLSVDLGRGLVLANPILVASGTFGYGVEYGDVVDIQRLGAICCKGTTLKARIGNITPRVTETPGGMLNSIGLQNPGVDAVVEKYAGTWTGWKVPVIVNVAGESVQDYVEVTRRLDGVPGRRRHRAQHQLPERRQGRLQFAIDAAAAGEVTAAVRRATDLPLLVKLSPNVADVRPIARAIADAGADALTAINTLSGIAVAPARAAARQRLRRPVRAGDQAGRAADRLRGRPGRRHPGRRDRRRDRAGRRPRLPRVGAVAVQVGTAIFADPTLPVRLVDELSDGVPPAGVASHRDLIGTALPESRAPHRRRASSTGREWPSRGSSPCGLPKAVDPRLRRAVLAAPQSAVSRRSATPSSAIVR